MKKRNISKLKLIKCKVSNLNALRYFIGGTGSINALETLITDCEGNCETYTQQHGESENPTDCMTNDTTRSLGTPTFVIACNRFGTGMNCINNTQL
ncbi:hypothetical protein [uncultured Kordia sp.]|uniref:hypothetical protein n=1 Tax=uncultured Kordia sp. TaxID=507699 RepID=UPI002612A1A8|nr:hypothetical protein [uncultured Kordia sp.]